MTGGDPGSTSALGGALRSQAMRLADLVDELQPLAMTTRSASAARADLTAHERALLSGAADELDRVGGVLQTFRTATVETLARLRDLDERARATGLFVDDTRVAELPGPSRVDPQVRLQAREHLQELLNRATSGRAKELTRLTRELERSGAALARLSDRARAARD